jgi:alkanesulfonate monooxygenase SsuD/methylene tetrahydromethanopterin reductase-like flavin-dependent oxidoreductase (luciferase family)
MQFDYMLAVWTHGQDRPYRDVIADYTSQVRLAESAGFQTAWFGEHHFQEEGFDTLPNPVQLGTHLAAHTESIRLGLGAITLPTWHPIRAAEDIATLDHLSSGRVDCAFSRGIDPRDILNLNPAADRSNADQSMALFTESIEIVRGAWTEDAFSYQGQFYTLPHPGMKARQIPWYTQDPRRISADGDQIALSVVPKPFQEPHPPLFLVSENTAGFEMAANNGMRAITWLPTGQRLTSLVEAYQAAATAATGREHALGEGTGILRPTFVAKTFEEAKRATKAAVENMGGSMTRGPRGRAAFAAGPDDVDETTEFFDYLLARDHVLVGSPESVAEQIHRLNANHGMAHILFWMPFYGVAHTDVLQSIELFAETVMPQVADL